MNSPLISIIVPVYNVEPYLDKCVESILRQTYQNIEVILINDGSTDKSGEIVLKYENEDSRIKAIHQDNRGLSAARNIGIKASAGEYVSFIDSDDYVTDDYIQKLYEAIVTGDSDLSSASFYNVYGEKAIPSGTRQKRVVSGGVVAKEFLTSVLGNDNRAAWGKLFKREMLIDNNLSFPLGKRHEDLAFLFESFCLSEKISFVGEPLYYYVHRESSITTSKGSGPDYDYDMVELADTIPGIAKRFNFVDRNDVNRFLLEKRLSYVYTRVRKGSELTRFHDIRDWLEQNREMIAADHIPRKDKIMVSVISLGRVPAQIFFTMVSFMVKVMKLRGLA